MAPTPDFISDATLDFHDRGPLLPFDVETLFHEFIEDCQIAGYHNLLIITGRGPRVRPIVNKLLNEDPRIQSFKSAGYFNGQDGAFEVEI